MALLEYKFVTFPHCIASALEKKLARRLRFYVCATLNSLLSRTMRDAPCRSAERGSRTTRNRPSRWEDDVREGGNIRGRQDRTYRDKVSANREGRRDARGGRTYQYFASCPPGLEKALAEELGQPNIDAKMITPGHIGVSFEGSILSTYNCLSIREDTGQASLFRRGQA